MDTITKTLLAISFIFLFYQSVSSADLTSASFIVKDPVIGAVGGLGTSASFSVLSSGDILMSGYGTSASFIGSYGFLYYPQTLTAPSLTFAISDNTISFGTLTTSGPRYATTGGGSGTSSVAHTLSASSNATNGYSITYYGATLTTSGGSITPATITGDVDGTPGSSQFAISASTNGTATIPSPYNQSANNWSFVASTTTQIASTAGATASEDFSMRYLSNISSTTPAGSYATTMTYVITGNF